MYKSERFQIFLGLREEYAIRDACVGWVYFYDIADSCMMANRGSKIQYKLKNLNYQYLNRMPIIDSEGIVIIFNLKK